MQEELTPRPAPSQFLRLSDHWALGYDQHQWIVQTKRTCKGREKWQPVAFVASERSVLMRVLREKGASVSTSASDALERLPERFTDWLAGLSEAECTERREAA